jgi:hypothetical protein
MNWVTVNMPWRIERSPEAAKLGQEFVDAVNASKARWKENNPDAFQLYGGGDLADEAIAIQDVYPFVKNALDAPNIQKWRDEGLRLAAEATKEHRAALAALVQHRYFHVLESNYISSDPEVNRTQAACQAQRDLERGMEFIHHPDCQVGVQIEVLSDGVTKRLLIGDITASGMDSGCCADGIRNEDLVIRYRDLRPLLRD